MKQQYKLNMKDVCIIIPIYNQVPEKSELYSIWRTIKKLDGREIVYLAGDNLDISMYPLADTLEVVRFPSSWFASTETYSRLLLTKEFYQRFQMFEYILICQTDVFVMGTSNDLHYFLEQNYDYWGAPWYFRARAYRRRCFGYKLFRLISRPRRIHVGNGGLSLRRVSAMIQFLEKYEKEASYTNELEDWFIAYYGEQDSSMLKIAPVEKAGQFAQETGAREMYKKTKEKPFGVHAWLKYFPEVLFEDEDFEKNQK